jgi:N-methylhydantoinase B
MADRKHHPAPGIMGGGSGAPSDIRLADGTEPHLKARTTLPSDARISLSFPGGGGYGPPAERAPESVEEDLRCGYVSPDAVRREYGR